MSQRQDYEAKLPEAEALKKEQIQSPYMTMKEFFEDTESLAVKALAHKEKLLEAGLRESILADMEVLNNATIHAESQWAQERHDQEAAVEEWKKKSPAAYKFRDYLLSAARYAFRKDDNKLKTVAYIAEGRTNADMIQDLSDLSVMGSQNPEAFAKIGVEASEFEKASAMSEEMLNLRAKANGTSEINEERVIRDRFYTLTKELADEVRDCARFVFHDDPDTLDDFNTRYN